jgi:DAACS family dicarboxylate/amino acid:cation (Na+ or H+) symporter
MVPDNPFRAAAEGDMIGLILVGLLFGVSMTLVRSPATERFKEVVQGLFELAMRLIEGLMKIAPIAVAALLFTTMAQLGVEILRHIAVYAGVVIGALAIHMFVVYSLAIRLLARRSPLAFFRDVKLAMATAFATASSNATLPTALKVADENLKLPRDVSRFVLTAGATMNQNGTALFEGVTVLFLAQLFGVPMGLEQQAMVMVIAILGGIGTAGVPAGSLPVVAMILAMFGIPGFGLALIMGVDRLLDMCRTTLNVTGDLVAATYVSRGHGDAEG